MSTWLVGALRRLRAPKMMETWSPRVGRRRRRLAAAVAVAPHVRGTGEPQRERRRKGRPARNEQSVRQRRRSSRTLGLGPWASAGCGLTIESI